MNPKIRFYNTLGRELQPFAPITAGKVGMYTCGLTVYNYAHIGNLRAYLFDDLLRRTLEHFGYEVTHVMNVTDVGHLTDDADAGEDKMLKSARERGMSVWDIAAFYTDAFLKDLDMLNIGRPTILCRATDHIQDMIDLIRRIEKNGYTYFAGGNLYFDVSKFPTYGELALLDRASLKSGARIEIDPNKRNPEDFVLWFTKSKFGRQAMIWDSPWGEGYPGWHIECSAMSVRYLGEHFDIHCGGVDHIPVHHTNEIAQTEAATGTKWVNYWMHNEFLLLEGAKMAKSAGGFVTLQTLVDEGFEPLDYRYFNLGAHYRTQLQFSREALAAARNARLNLVERTAELLAASEEAAAERPSRGRESSAAADNRSTFFAALADDLNAPRALAAVWALLKDEGVPPEDKTALLAAYDAVLGLRLLEAARESARRRSEDVLEERYSALIREREIARKNRNFARGDEIRDILREAGIIIEDTPGGTRWKRAK